MIKKHFFSIFLLIVITVQSQQIIQNNNQTKVSFKIKNFGINVDGSFSNIAIKTNLSSQNLNKSFLEAEILVKSISTGNQSRDKHILEKDYFDVENYQKIVLKSKEIQRSTNKETLILKAYLTVKGITKQIEVPLYVKESKDSLFFSANFSINRKDFKIGKGSVILSKTVNISVVYFGNKLK